MTEFEKMVAEVTSNGSNTKNFGGGSPGEYGMDLPKGVDTSKMSAAALKMMFGWETQTITLDSTISVPTQNLTVQLFQTIYNPGVSQANGTVQFQDPANNNLYVLVSSTTAAYVAIRNQTQTRAMKVHLIRMVVSNPNQFNNIISYQTNDTFGWGDYKNYNPQEYIDPQQLQTQRLDIPIHKKSGIIREDTGYNIIQLPNVVTTLTFFYERWNSSGAQLEAHTHSVHNALNR